MKRKHIITLILCFLLITASCGKTVNANTYSKAYVTDNYNWYLDDGSLFASFTIDFTECYGPLVSGGAGACRISSISFNDTENEYTTKDYSDSFNTGSNIELHQTFYIYQNGILINTIYYDVSVVISGYDTISISSSNGNLIRTSISYVRKTVYI